MPSCPFQFVALRVICLDGSTAGSPEAGNKGCLERPQSQRLTGKPCGPTPHQSGAGRNPWPPGKTGWHPPPCWSPFGWSRVAVWLKAGGLRTRDPAIWKALHLPFAATFQHIQECNRSPLHLFTCGSTLHISSFWSCVPPSNSLCLPHKSYKHVQEKVVSHQLTCEPLGYYVPHINTHQL